ncbi:hypothetical protein VB713_16000 [Anabaena cylindrica UHCC 0172]|uniref:hypothetical protein n=1 Tax=Anabaena cylindrica TaxID=1165 RepID=UPI002B20A0E6|nr:hypothetical protein [Anabaena cylindrica]MEA5552446.1 hypothetical protein [Anabaena cylindrica UHCC 0172]
MNLGITLAVFSIVVGIPFIFYADYLGAISFISLGISIALIENVGSFNLINLSNSEIPLIKVIFAWLTLAIFVVLFSYKIFRDHSHHS